MRGNGNRHSPLVAVIGCGYWGRNLVRNFHELGVLACVCDVQQDVLSEVSSRYGVLTTSDLETVLANPEIRAVVIATPAAQHYEIAKRSLLRGKDVYVEKPLALSVPEGEQLVGLASTHKRVLFVGHILEYHPAICELRRLIQEGHLGKIRYVYSSRLNLGKLRKEENILWSFAPHDISATLSLLGEMPSRVSAHGASYLQPGIADTTLTTCTFPSGVSAHIFVSWLHPFKEQKLTVVADRKMAVFDDLEPERKLVLYPHRIEWLDRVPVAHREPGEVVSLPKIEPLRQECKHFLECVANRTRPRTDGESALRVLRVLRASEESLKSGGQPVEMMPTERAYYAHPSAVIDGGSDIGEGTKIWHFSHIMEGSKLGKTCNLGQNVMIGPGVVIGSNVKIQNNVSIYTGVQLEDDVFCGPSMVFTNVANPRSHVVRRHQYKHTLVRQGATLGANSTIVCGITVGRYAFVAAGAVANRDVPDYALVAGVPARQIGWMCHCGMRLRGTGAELTCTECARRYSVADGVCTPRKGDDSEFPSRPARTIDQQVPVR